MEISALIGESTTEAMSGWTGSLDLMVKHPETVNGTLFEGLVQKVGMRVTFRSSFLDKDDQPFGWFYRISPYLEPPFKTEAEAVILDEWNAVLVAKQAYQTVMLVDPEAAERMLLGDHNKQKERATFR